MDNRILLEHLKKIPELKIIKHAKNDLYNGQCLTRKQHHRRFNVIGDINPSGSSFILFSNGKWTSKNKLGIKTVEQAIEWVKKDIEYLSK
jgi:hypothetical protein